MIEQLGLPPAAVALFSGSQAFPTGVPTFTSFTATGRNNLLMPPTKEDPEE
jgi:hypothetical protein